MPKIVNTSLKAKAWTFEAKAKAKAIKFGHEAPRGQGLASRTTSLPKMHRFSDIRLQKCCDLENRVRSPSRSLEISPFDRAHRDPIDVLSNYGSILCRF